MKTLLTLVLLLSTLDTFAGYGSRSSSSRSSFSSSRSSFSSSRSSSFSRPSSSRSFFSSSKPSTPAMRPTVFRPASTGFTSAPKAYSAPKIIPLRTTAPLSPRKTVVVPTTISRPSSSVTPRYAGNQNIVVVPRTRVVTRTVYRTQPRYYHNNTYYSYPSVSLTSMALTAALLSAARHDWTYTAIHIKNQTPSRVCKCDYTGKIYDCGFFRDEDDYVCKQFRVLPDDQVEWR